MASKKEPAILIVGAGPCGLVLALTLLQNNIPVRIIDKSEVLQIAQRASAIMPRTLEIYRFLGVISDVLRLYIPFPRVRTCELGKGVDEVISIFDMSPYIVPTPDCPYLNPILVGQSRVQGILGEHLKKYGCEVEFGTELKSLEQFDDGVVAHLIKTKGETEVNEDVRVRYLVGADGGRSVVRKQIGLSFVGETREGEDWVFADVRLKGVDKEFWHIWGDFHKGFVMIRPTEAHADDVFWVVIAGHNLDWPKVSTKPEEFANCVRELSGLHSLEFQEFFSLGHYRINIRSVDTLRQGRVFLAGDAAHTHSFTGGQGMNTSVSDAFNLGWKIAYVVKSISPPGLVESYTSERIPTITRIIEKTTKLLNRTVELSAEDDGDVYRRGPDLFQLDVNYLGSSIVFDELDSPSDDEGGRVMAGSRSPNAPGLVPLTPGLKPGASELFDVFDPTHHTALVFARSGEDITPLTSALAEYPSGSIFTVVVMPKGHTRANEDISVFEPGLIVVVDSQEFCWTTYPTSEGARVVIVRPDGYIGAITRSVEGIGRYRAIVFDTNVNGPQVVQG